MLTLDGRLSYVGNLKYHCKACLKSWLADDPAIVSRLPGDQQLELGFAPSPGPVGWHLHRSCETSLQYDTTYKGHQGISTFKQKVVNTCFSVDPSKIPKDMPCSS